MKFNLNGSKRPPAAPGAHSETGEQRASAPTRSTARTPAGPQRTRSETYGRSCEPPPPGSSYWEFLQWASEGGMPLPEDTDLAVSMWMGVPPGSDESYSAPGPR